MNGTSVPTLANSGMVQLQADLLDRLLITLAVRLHAFSVCEIQRGWRLVFSPFEAITIHYVLRGSGSLRVGQGPWIPFAPPQHHCRPGTPVARHG